MPKRILIMGLPGAGKTYLAQHIVDHLQADKKKVGWLNADDVRKKYNDWDFSHEGRIRQSLRMRELADAMTDIDFVICDFVAPLVEMRNNFKADWTVWVDTIREGRYAVYANPRKAGNGVQVTEYRHGEASRRMVALAYKAQAMGITI